MVAAVEAIRGQLETLFLMFADNAVYEDMDILMAVRGLRADELWGSAMQGDRLGIVRARDFRQLFNRQPKKYDKVVIDQNYTVQEWKRAPGTGVDPVWYKLALRGGSV